MFNPILSNTEYSSLKEQHQAGICGGWCSYCYFEPFDERNPNTAGDKYGDPLYHILLDYKVTEVLIAMLLFSSLFIWFHVK